jgi:adenylate cyclase
VLEDRRTLYRSPESSESASLALVESVVASPIFDQDEEVVGVVYGARRNDSVITRTGISPLEAQLVQLLAAAVSAGLARKEQEANAARNRARFEQFFSPELADELERNPSLLDAATRDITIFFSDIRSFSRISEVLPARDLFRFVSDVMDHLTECILQHKGVIIDYYGDGVAAMWNAPTDLPDHAELACRAAIAMQEAAVELNEKWQETIGMPLKFGIGINTGTAEVGNAGSTRRLKYGPRGHAVNLAARVEGATKQLGVPVLVTGKTRAALAKEFPTRRLCSVRVVGIEESVDLHELYCGSPDKSWLKRRDKYEQALTLYESRNGDEAAQLVDELLAADKDQADRASQLLAERITDLRQSRDTHDTVYQLQSK